MKKAILMAFAILFFLLLITPQASQAYQTDYRYIGQLYDSADNLYYLNQRYYDPKTGRFTQSDLLQNMLAAPDFNSATNLELQEYLSNPQKLNYYSYANNNPLNFSDPSGLLTVIIPGTFYNPQDFSSAGAEKDFINSVSKTFNETHSTIVVNDKNIWSGADNNAARQKAADYIVQMINNYQFSTGEQLNIVGHSHGGNVGILASQKVNRKIDNLVTLATPVRNDYKPNSSMIGRQINAYSIIDVVQAMGGGGNSVSRLIGGLLFGPLGGFLGGKLNLGEFGLAGRIYKGAKNINVTGQSKLGLIGAHFMTRMPAVWSKVSSFLK